jgi:hypothetical protein
MGRLALLTVGIALGVMAAVLVSAYELRSASAASPGVKTGPQAASPSGQLP